MGLSNTATAAFALNKPIALKADKVRPHSIVRQFQGGREVVDSARLTAKQRENLAARAPQYSLTPSLRFHIEIFRPAIKPKYILTYCVNSFFSIWYLSVVRSSEDPCVAFYQLAREKKTIGNRRQQNHELLIESWRIADGIERTKRADRAGLRNIALGFYHRPDPGRSGQVLSSALRFGQIPGSAGGQHAAL